MTAMGTRRWLWALLGLAVTLGTAALHGQRLTPSGAQGARVVDAVRQGFPRAVGWFRLVADARYTEDASGALTPDHATLHHPRVRQADGAGHAMVPRFPATFTSALRVSVVGEEGAWVDVTPLGALPARARVEDGLVVYPGAFTDTDVLYKSTPTHTDEYLFLHSERAPTVWRYRVALGPHLASLRQTPGAVEVLDPNGAARLRASRPVATDARGDTIQGELQVDGDVLVATLDLRGRAFPVLVDPDWRPTGDMAYGRFYHGAHVLPNGRVLATGGCSASVCSGDLTIPACRTLVGPAETLDLGTRSWSRAGDDPVARFFHLSESLADGSVLVAGGCTDPDCTTTTAAAHRYDPASQTFQPVGGLSEPRAGLNAVRLRDGSILAAGGCTSARCSNRVERFDPGTRVWSRVSDLPTPRGRAVAVLLEDGRVLVAGGCTTITCAGVVPVAEVYDPTTDRWTAAQAMSTPRGGHWGALLVGGRVVVGGGCPEGACNTFLATTELFDPTTLRWTPGPRHRVPRVGARAVRLPDGTVMVSQGCQSRTGCDLTNEVLDLRATTFSAVEPALTIRAFHETVVHGPGRLVIAIGGCQPRTCSWWNETYDIAGLRPLQDAGVDAPPGDSAPPPDGTQPPPTDVAVDTALADVPAGDGPVVPVTPPRPRGCGCRAPGAPPGAGGFALILGLLGVSLRRRAARGAR